MKTAAPKIEPAELSSFFTAAASGTERLRADFTQLLGTVCLGLSLSHIVFGGMLPCRPGAKACKGHTALGQGGLPVAHLQEEIVNQALVLAADAPLEGALEPVLDAAHLHAAGMPADRQAAQCRTQPEVVFLELGEGMEVQQGPEGGVLKHIPELGAGPGEVLPAVSVQEGEEAQQALPVELRYVHGEWWPHVSVPSEDLTCLLLPPQIRTGGHIWLRNGVYFWPTTGAEAWGGEGGYQDPDLHAQPSVVRPVFKGPESPGRRAAHGS